MSIDPSPVYPAARGVYNLVKATVKPKTANFEFIGKDMPRYDAYIKAAGTAMYTRDVSLPGMLYAQYLMCPYPHAKVTAIDTSKAAALPGVRAILTYDTKDVIPPITIPFNTIVGTGGLPIIPQEAKWEGEVIGVAVCADTEEICDQALKLMNVTYSKMTYYTTVLDAKSDSSTLQIDTSTLRNLIVTDFPNYAEDATQDVTAGLKAADKTVTGTVKLHQYTHHAAEPESVVAYWEGGALTLYLHTQTAQGTFGGAIGSALGIAGSKVKLILLNQGGSFGGGYFLNTQSRLAYTAAAFAAKTGQPVKMMMSRKQYCYGGEAEGYHTFTVGVKNDGTITAVKGESLIGQGAPGAYGTLWATTNHVANWVRYDLKSPFTHHYLSYEINTQPKWWSRSEQNHNARYLQAVLDYAADAVGMDPTAVYLKNSRTTVSATAAIAQAKKLVNFGAKWHLAKNPVTLPDGNLYGLGFYVGHSWGNYTIGGISAALTLKTDGTVEIVSCRDELGCSERTTYAMIVAEEMGLAWNDVYMPPQNTDVGFISQESGGAAGNHGNSWLYAKLGIAGKAYVLGLAATSSTFPAKTTADQLDMKDSVIFLKSDPTKTMKLSAVPALVATNQINQTAVTAAIPGFGWAEENMFAIFVPVEDIQCNFVEVEVNPNTGQVDVTNIVEAYDCGKALRPASAQGQLAGQGYMGLQRGCEQTDLIFDPQTGVRLNPDMLNKHVSTCVDAPATNNPAYMEVVPSDGAYGQTGVGEMNITIACAIISAVHNATGKWIDPPITPDRVLRALGKA